MRKSDSNTAGPQGAGYIFQLERALYHLATASSFDDVVAVEHFDDVAILHNDKLILVEQDKSTTNSRAKIINDRSRALWRTLQIWLQIRETAEGAGCKKHLLFMNVWQPSPLVTLLRDRVSSKIEPIFILDELRKIGKKKSGAKIDAIISDVLLRSDDDIINLIEKIEVVVADDYTVSRGVIANGFALHPHADAELVIDGLLGWLTMKARIHWSEKKGALVSRREVLLQCHALQDKQRKSRFLPRASSEIEINPGAHEKALTRNFVEHLARISADNEDVVQAIDHFLKFSAEKYRLVKSGSVLRAEWGNRSRRLSERWANIMRRRRREMANSSAGEIGLAVLADVTYEYREYLDGYLCDELYMTSGNYHRLAESNRIWWDPTFKGGDDK